MQIDNQNNINDLSFLEKTKKWYRALPDKKRYLEFITALLSIPVLLTVAISNVMNLQQGKVTPTPTPMITIIQSPSISPTERTVLSPKATVATSPIPTSTPTLQCKKEVGPIEIAYPEENQTVSEDPVCLDIVRSGTDYCSVVWSYRINGSTWTEYTDRSICMYGLPPGEKKLELRVKSIVTGAEIVLKRTFTIQGSPTATPTQTPAPTP